MKYVGVDGCKGGWFAVWVDNEHWGSLRFDDFSQLWEAHSDAKCILVDMPVGLPDESVRLADSQARAMLRQRKCSVFNTPVRSAVYAASKAEAKSINEKLVGKSLSEQSLAIAKKIYEVDVFLNSEKGARETVFESHPELCFAKAVGNPLKYGKKDFLGGLERFKIIEGFIPNVEEMLEDIRGEYPKSVVEVDDMLDAFILAISAWKSGGELVPVPNPPEVDAMGLRMAVWYHDFTVTT